MKNNEINIKPLLEDTLNSSNEPLKKSVLNETMAKTEMRSINLPIKCRKNDARMVASE